MVDVGISACEYDYVVVGGGLCGVALAAELSKKNPTKRVILLEAGITLTYHSLTHAPLDCFRAHYSTMDWAYHTSTQHHLNNRVLYQGAGKGLGGGSAINYGMWTKGSKHDYDLWSKVVDDPKWGYDEFSPYLNGVECWLSKACQSPWLANGKIVTASVSESSDRRRYPLREKMLEAWEALDNNHITDPHDDESCGIREMVENWDDGQRQIANCVFDLSEVTVETSCMVQKIFLEGHPGNLHATGVLTEDGRTFFALNEVILAAGAYRTPQIMMLSGIGPEAALRGHGISPLVNLPGVGQNLHDHLVMSMCFKLKDANAGYAMGGSAGPWADPAYALGLPCDWIVNERVPLPIIEEGIRKDLEVETSSSSDLDQHALELLAPSASHLEMFFVYRPAGRPLANNHVPADGSHIGALVSNFRPASRGSIGISSDNISHPPVVDPNYNATHVDRDMLRHGVRRVLKLVADSLSDVVEAELPPERSSELTCESSDEDIDARIRDQGRSFFNAGGTASMGRVVDTNLLVKGVNGLRIVDASVIPVPLAAHYQVVCYALATKAADLISTFHATVN
ncbi:hypothetical protein PV08_07125 [Exophiala spinifera]|uniref:Glucose-methanol-choline oxidoreductase N-terminal domain-containing protein n=1 Tax=Exophiala spinifera TaxID=91928 RepID=A0A0D2B608_9EURO|nr:uncharacterized protein PV08_07125 [Exophiala spinifera]KIW14343.1 hypothetical protein PV08_07125 [Exophiala spinifera]